MRVALALGFIVSVILLASSAACGSGEVDESGDPTSQAAGATRTAQSGRTAVALGTASPGVSDGGAGARPPNGDATSTSAQNEPDDPDGDPNLTGGSPDEQPNVVATVPPVTPAPGVTPRTDPTAVAPPNANGGGVRLLIDLDASTPGIQATRSVDVGDVFRVAVVVTNVPPLQNNRGGVAAFNFTLNYDKTTIIAPTITGGASVDRNPKLNVEGLGGAAAQWNCLPAPEGDRDDPGGLAGDGDPSTGEAFLSCFATGTGREAGTLVLGVVTFHAVAAGEMTMSLKSVAVGDALSTELASCPGDGGVNPVPCETARLSVR